MPPKQVPVPVTNGELLNCVTCNSNVNVGGPGPVYLIIPQVPSRVLCGRAAPRPTRTTQTWSQVCQVRVVRPLKSYCVTAEHVDTPNNC